MQTQATHWSMRLFDLRVVSSLYIVRRSAYTAQRCNRKRQEKKSQNQIHETVATDLENCLSAWVFEVCCGCKCRRFSGWKIIHCQWIVYTLIWRLLHAQSLKTSSYCFHVFLAFRAEDNEPCCVRRNSDQGFFS